MKRFRIHKTILFSFIALSVWLCNGEFYLERNSSLIANAHAVRGAPATPISYAGVARRSTVGAGTRGVGVTPGVGVGAPGVGVAPGVSTPTNRGGPVNRVGRR